MRILIVGAGSTGGYFGGRLAEAGRDVTFLVREGRARSIGQDGLRIVSPHGDATIKPKLVTAGTVDGPYDAVFLSVKAFSLEAAIDDFAPAVGPDTLILPVLNGMKHMDLLAERFGRQAVVGGLCKIASTLDGEGRVVQLAKFHELAYGEMDGETSSRIRELDRFMQGAGFDARLTTDIAGEMWEKWMMLASLAAATCLMRGSVGEIEAAPGGADFARSLLAEIVAIIEAVGKKPRAATVEQVRRMLTTPGSDLTASMFRDLQGGGFVEADHIIGDLLARGGKAGVATPLLATAYAHLSVYQARRAKS